MFHRTWTSHKLPAVPDDVHILCKPTEILREGIHIVVLEDIDERHAAIVPFALDQSYPQQVNVLNLQKMRNSLLRKLQINLRSLRNPRDRIRPTYLHDDSPHRLIPIRFYMFF